MSVSVLGSGAFGTALAISLAGNGPVALWSSAAPVRRSKCSETRENSARLPGVTLPENIAVTEG